MFNLFNFNEDIKTEFIFFGKTSMVINQTHSKNKKDDIIALNSISYLVHFLCIYSDHESIKRKTKEFIANNIANDLKITRNEDLNALKQSDLSPFFDFIRPILKPKELEALQFLTNEKMWSIEYDYYFESSKKYNLPIDNEKAKYTFKFKITDSQQVQFKLNAILKLSIIYLPLTLIGLLDYSYFNVNNDTQKKLIAAFLDILNNYDSIRVSDRFDVISKINSKYFN